MRGHKKNTHTHNSRPTKKYSITILLFFKSGQDIHVWTEKMKVIFFDPPSMSVWTTSTNWASVGSRRFSGGFPVNSGPAGSNAEERGRERGYTITSGAQPVPCGACKSKVMHSVPTETTCCCDVCYSIVRLILHWMKRELDSRESVLLAKCIRNLVTFVPIVNWRNPQHTLKHTVRWSTQ